MSTGWHTKSYCWQDTSITAPLLKQSSETQHPFRHRDLTLCAGPFLPKPNRPAGILHVPSCLGRKESRATSEGLQDNSRHQRSCQARTQGRALSVRAPADTCGTQLPGFQPTMLWERKPECLLYLMNESGSWKGSVQTATMGHLTLVEGRFSVTKTGENKNPREPPHTFPVSLGPSRPKSRLLPSIISLQRGWWSVRHCSPQWSSSCPSGLTSSPHPHLCPRASATPSPRNCDPQKGLTPKDKKQMGEGALRQNP